MNTQEIIRPASQRRFVELLRRPPARWCVTLFILLFPPLYFYPALLGEVVLMPGDAWLYSLPMRMLSGSMLRAGTPPLWNPFTFGGMPLLGAIQPGVLYPPNWLFAVLTPAQAMNLVVITTYQFTLAGVYRYGRCLRLNRLAALLAALCFGFGGFMIGHIEDTNYIAAVAWLPWLLLALEQLHRRASWRWVTLGAVMIALQCFAGLPQAGWQTACLCGAYCLFTIFLRGPDDEAVSPQRDKGTKGQRPAQGLSFVPLSLCPFVMKRLQMLRFVGAVAAMCVCGLLLSAVQLLPTLELQALGTRAGIGYEEFSLFSLPPRRVLALAFPYFFGGGHPPLYRVPGWDEWWTLKWSFAYVGQAGLLLSLTALWLWRKERLVIFWAIVAGVSLCLSFGSHLPFELHRLLHRIPIHNLFRAPYRHSLPLTFALAMLTGYAVNHLARVAWPQSRRALRISTTLATAFVGTAAVIYGCFPALVGSPPPTSLLQPEAAVPLLCFALSVAAVWWYARRPARATAAALLLVCAADLTAFGFFTQWLVTGRAYLEMMADAPAVAFIKEREKERRDFRVADAAQWPFGPNYAALNHGNLAAVRGLQSVNGYDPMRPARTAALAGEMDIFGKILRAEVFDAADQSFNLLNLKYLLHERQGEVSTVPGLFTELAGIRFRIEGIDLSLKPGARRELDAGGAVADELALTSAMSFSTHLPDDTPVARIKLKTVDGREITRELLMGRDTAEWAYDRADVAAAVKHHRAQVAESRPGENFQAHSYLARFTFARAAIDRIVLEYLLPEAELSIARASLYDGVNQQSYAVDAQPPPAERWRKLQNFGPIDVYENLQAMPRAWFVRRLVAQPSADVLRTIRTSKLADGTPFDPAETALFDVEDFGGRAAMLPAVGVAPAAEVRITNYEPLRIDLQTRNAQAGFLVLSENYYRGWDALLDGQRAPVERVNYTLRGLAVPAGEHHIAFVFRAPSFRLGLKYSAAGASLLLIGAIISARRKRRGKP